MFIGSDLEHNRRTNTGSKRERGGRECMYTYIAGQRDEQNLDSSNELLVVLLVGVAVKVVHGARAAVPASLPRCRGRGREVRAGGARGV